MKGMRGIASTDRQLRWAALLLIAAVVLPTVCLLWFMSQAVRNERFAVKQKLIDVCNSRVNDFRQDFHEVCLEQQEQHISRLKQLSHISNASLWGEAFEDYAEGLVIYGVDDQLIYPVVGRDVEYGFTKEIQYAFDLERRGNYSEALAKYRRITDSSENGSVIFATSMGTIRCLDKLGKHKESLALFDELLDYDKQIRIRLTASQVARIRVGLVEWLAKNDEYERSDMYRDLTAWYTPEETYSAETTVWALKRIIKIATEQSEQERLGESIDKAKEIIERESISLAAAEFFSNGWRLRTLPERKWKAFKADRILYAIRYFDQDKEFIIIKTREKMLSWVEPKLDEISIDGVGIRLLDDMGNVLSGSAEMDSKPFVTTGVDDCLPGWKLELYFEDGGIFDAAASRQTAIYTWTGILVVLLILASGAIAAQAVGRQIKLNKLKNDFVATVTHELKTPLASMRVLVDTLLEGNYEGEDTATEYLRMICKENERLSRLIDNFLCFSRMERNKQAFTISQAGPVEIANAAAEAVIAKFDDDNVRFDVKVEEPLPMVEVDEDAIVTVLVNLLENAYKYSGDDKQIELRVYAEQDCVCFSVKDNGVGLPRKAINKIFKRFYQVDSGLSRKTQGCGLGLSIVKFIVKAHKGRIDVKSEPGKGSTFTVVLAAIKSESGINN